MKKWYRYLAAGVLVLLTLCVAGCGGVSHKSPDENDLSMMNAYLFVNQTKVEEMQEPESTNDTTNLKD